MRCATVVLVQAGANIPATVMVPIHTIFFIFIEILYFF